MVFVQAGDLSVACPLEVESVAQYGIAFRVTLRNPKGQPLRLRTLHITYSDPLGNYHGQTYRYQILAQPHQRLTVTTPPISEAVVDWRTAAASARCRPLSDEDD
jgi:hypothetical protein